MIRLLVIAAIGLLLLAGCGGSSNTNTSSMELAKEIATAMGHKATEAYRRGNKESCGQGEGCAYHEPTTFEINEKEGCTPTTEHPGYNWECNFIEANEAGRGYPTNWLVDREASGCWKVVELSEHNEKEEQGNWAEANTPYVENCTQSGREGRSVVPTRTSEAENG